MIDWPPRHESHTPNLTGAPWEPWLTREAIGILERTLTRRTKLFEFGAGASTVWYAKRCLFVNAVEHDPEWVSIVEGAIAEEKLKLSASVNHGPPDNNYELYLRVAGVVLENSGPYDVVVVDGRCRVRSVRLAAPHVRPGGLLVLDNAERPWYAPVREILSDWSHQETSNGLWRTDIFRRPA